MERTISRLAVVFLLLLTTQAFTQKENKNISNIELNQLLKEGKSLLLIDVRTPEEYKTGYIKGAVNIDFYNKDFKSQLAQVSSDKPIVLYCTLGVRSKKATKILDELGVKDYYNLLGGINRWIKKGYPLSK